MVGQKVIIEKSSYKRIIFTGGSLLLFILFHVIGYSYQSGIALFISTMLMNLLLIYKSYKKRNGPLLIIFLYTAVYTFVIRNALLFNRQLSVYSEFNDNEHLYKTTSIFLLFFICLYSTLKINPFPKKEILKRHNNIYFFYAFYFLAIIFAIYGKTGDNLFETGAYYGEGRVIISSLNEYFLIPFVLSIIFSDDKKNILIYALAIFYAIKNVTFGGRIEVMMLLLTIYMWKFSAKLHVKQIIIGSIAAFYIFNAIGNFRKNPMLLLSNQWYNVFIQESKRENSDIIISQEGDVIYASTRLISMADENIINPTERFSSFTYFIASFILPYSTLPEIANLSKYKSTEYNVGGGGLPFAYFYVFLSYIGVVLIALFIGNILGKIGSCKTYFTTIYTFFVFITLPRWYAYSPIVLFKLCIYGTLLTLILVYIHSIMKKSKK